MKVMVCGSFRLGGKSKLGNDFDMCQLKVLRPAESFATDKLKCTAYGFEAVDLQLDVECLPQFSELRYPLMLDLVVSDRLTRKGIESVVTGFIPPTKIKSDTPDGFNPMAKAA
jgi:hypothetical protein